MSLPSRPDYQGGSIVNLMSSLSAGLGGDCARYPPLRLLPPAVVTTAANVVLLVIDGLGYHYLCNHPGALSAYLRGPITSVFPTSTAPAVTTFLTATAPQQHAVTGWFMYFRELGTVGKILPFQARWGGSSLAAAGVTAGDLIGRPSIFNHLEADGYFVIDQQFVDSSYTLAGAGCAERVGYRDLEHCFFAIRRIVKKRARRKFIYAYWPQLDALAHQYGIGSAAVERHFEELDRAFAGFVEALRDTGTLVIVTADHGFIDTAPNAVIRLQAHPELADCLALPLCGEPRVAYCYLRPGRFERFQRYVKERLADHCELYASEQLLNEGWFGLGEPEPRLRQRIGDAVLVAKGRAAIVDRVLGEETWSDIGVHGGIGEDEMLTPLIVAHC